MTSSLVSAWRAPGIFWVQMPKGFRDGCIFLSDYCCSAVWIDSQDPTTIHFLCLKVTFCDTERDSTWSVILIYTQVGRTHTKLISKSGSKHYFLVVLRRSGVSVNYLIKVYMMFISPGVGCLMLVWLPGLSKSLADNHERVQSSSILSPFPDLSYRETLNITELQILRDRTAELCCPWPRTYTSDIGFNQHDSHSLGGSWESVVLHCFIVT